RRWGKRAEFLPATSRVLFREIEASRGARSCRRSRRVVFLRRRFCLQGSEVFRATSGFFQPLLSLAANVRRDVLGSRFLLPALRQFLFDASHDRFPPQFHDPKFPAPFPARSTGAGNLPPPAELRAD